MKGYLLDINLLIALHWPSHERHDLALKWFARHRAKGWVTCPFTQAGFVRIVSNPAFSRDAVHPREAIHILFANTAAKDHTFWPDAPSIRDTTLFNPSFIRGHRQLTDIYLLGLAKKMNGTLATFDRTIPLASVVGAARATLSVISAVEPV